jgi:DNA mismatch endonuclease, patch repair protein
MDTVSPEKRSWIMSRIKGKDTSPELLVRKFVHALGLRFRLHTPGLPGKPDLSLPRFKKAIFVNGCYWHGHAGCADFRFPKTHKLYWRAKIERNRERDVENLAALRRAGWKSLVVWECELSNPMKAGEKIMRFLSA